MDVAAALAQDLSGGPRFGVLEGITDYVALLLTTSWGLLFLVVAGFCFVMGAAGARGCMAVVVVIGIAMLPSMAASVLWLVLPVDGAPAAWPDRLMNVAAVPAIVGYAAGYVLINR